MAINNYEDLSDELQIEATNILNSMAPVAGEVRQVEYCRCCSSVMGARFIPYGLGRGLRINTCWCRVTGNEQIGSHVLVLGDKPS